MTRAASAAPRACGNESRILLLAFAPCGFRRRRLRPSTEVWSDDFVYHPTDDDPAFRTLGILDDFTRESLATSGSAAGSRATDAIHVLTELFILRAIPATSAPTTSRSSSPRPTANGVPWSWPRRRSSTGGSQCKNGHIESFNARLRDDLLDGDIFYTLNELQVLIHGCRRHYSAVRPHSSLGYRTLAREATRHQHSRLDHSVGAGHRSTNTVNAPTARTSNRLTFLRVTATSRSSRMMRRMRLYSSRVVVVHAARPRRSALHILCRRPAARRTAPGVALRPPSHALFLRGPRPAGAHSTRTAARLSQPTLSSSTPRPRQRRDAAPAPPPGPYVLPPRPALGALPDPGTHLIQLATRPTPTTPA